MTNKCFRKKKNRQKFKHFKKEQERKISKIQNIDFLHIRKVIFVIFFQIYCRF